ncbi:YSIRK-type signal peptide-containing protein [uncultured Limosilactobacillus sp.]|uniref:YSIRK-type signal peptide-containing protein n=1 Tax=uncultured Limosilactobacillus sp. TaxID=2837629 RepID=UPI0025D4EF42|nr:YSIRK-type signal peptide-containing protein [uncultured Limosilactobacillus sp.]
MLSKNNWQAQLQKHEAKKQRFALRKLTVGVASVLIGFTLMGLGTAVHADTAVPSQTETDKTTEVSTPVTKVVTDHQSAIAKENNNQQTSGTASSQQMKAPVAVKPQADDSSASNQQNATNATNSTIVSMGSQLKPYGQTEPDLNGTSDIRFGNGAGQTSTTKIAYRLQTNSGMSSTYKYGNVWGWPGKGEFMLYAPTGFEFNTSQTGWLSILHGDQREAVSADQYKYQLGTVNGKEAILVTLDFIPYYGDGVTVLADLKLQANAKAGTYTAGGDLIRLIDNNDGSFKSGPTQNVTFTSDGTSTTYSELTANSAVTSKNNQYVVGDPVNTTPGNWTGTINSDKTNITQTVNYKTGDTADISYRLSSWNSAPQINNKGVGKTEYLVVIPRGFTTDKLNIINGVTINGQGPTAQNLGMVGPNGEQVFLVKVPYTPGYSLETNCLLVNAKLTVRDNVSGVFTETVNDLLHPINNGNFATGAVSSNIGGGTSTITIGGQTYQIIKSTASSENNSITYVVNPKNTTPANWSGTIWTNDNSSWSHDNTTLSPAKNYGTGSSQTKTATISYRLSSYGSGPQLNDRGIGPTQYLVMIPYGFKTDGLTFANGISGKDATYEDLGMVGPHGEQVFLVSVPYTPGYSSDNSDSYSLRVNAKLTAQGGINGVYTFSANDLLHPIANGNFSTKVINDNGITGGEATITLGGKTYTIVKSTAFNNSISYLMGDAQLAVNFNGSVDWKPATEMYGKKPGDVSSATITYNIKSNSKQATGGQDGFNGESKYLIYIPAGFEVNGTPTATGSYGRTGDVTFKNLGFVGGPDEQQVWEVTAPTRPSDSNPLQIKTNLVLTTHTTKDENGAAQPYGGYYSTSTGALLKAVNATVDGEKQFSDQTTTVTLGEGANKTEYQVVAADGSDDSYGYTIDIGTTLLNKGGYVVSGTKGIAVNTPVASNVAGYEQLTIEGMTFNPGAIAEDGNYVDVHWGVLYNDNGTVKRKLYDKVLSSTVGVILSNDGQRTVIGHVYNMGDFYRLVFNKKAQEENSDGKLIANSFELNWATTPQYAGGFTTNNDGHTATVNNGPFVYTYTDDQSKDGTIDKNFIPKNDVLIGSTADQSNSQQLTSGIKLQQEYVYQGSTYKNNKTQSTSTTGPTRTWYGNSGSWTCSKLWQNVTTYMPDLKETSKSFDLVLQLPANPNNEFTISAKSGDEVAKELYNIIAKSQERKLSNELTDNQANYLVATTKKGGIQDNAQESDVSVIREQDKNDPNTYIYHIKFAKQYDIEGGISLVTVTANTDKLGDIELPHGVSSYDQDMAARIQKGNYYGANVGNAKLQKALEDLPEVLVKTTDIHGTTTTYNAFWTTFISHTAEKAPDNAMTVTKAQSYNFAGGKSIWIWSGDNQLNDVLTNSNSFKKLTRAMRVGGLNKDNGIKKDDGTVSKPVTLKDVQSYTWLGGNFTDDTTPGWSKQSGNMKITFTDGSSAVFELDVLIVAKPVVLPLYVPVGYMPTDGDGDLLFADYGAGAGHPGRYKLKEVNGKQTVVGDGGFKWIQQPYTAISGPNYGLAELAFQIADYKFQKQNGKPVWTEIKHPKLSDQALYQLSHYPISVNNMEIAPASAGDFMPGVLHGTKATVTYDRSKDGQVNKLTVYSNQNGHRLADYRLNQEGHFVSETNHQLLAVNNQPLKISTNDQMISPARLQAIINTSLLDQYGLNLAVLNTNLQLGDHTATGNATVQLADDFGNRLKIALPVMAPVQLVANSQPSTDLSDDHQPTHDLGGSHRTETDQPTVKPTSPDGPTADHPETDLPDQLSTDAVRPGQSTINHHDSSNNGLTADQVKKPINNSSQFSRKESATGNTIVIEEPISQSMDKANFVTGVGTIDDLHDDELTAHYRVSKVKQLPQTGNQRQNMTRLMVLMISLSAILLAVGITDKRHQR